MDFTVEQFLGMFHRHNEAIRPMQIVGYALGLLVVAMRVAIASPRRLAKRSATALQGN